VRYPKWRMNERSHHPAHTTAAKRHSRLSNEDKTQLKLLEEADEANERMDMTRQQRTDTIRSLSLYAGNSCRDLLEYWLKLSLSDSIEPDSTRGAGFFNLSGKLKHAEFINDYCNHHSNI